MKSFKNYSELYNKLGKTYFGAIVFEYCKYLYSHVISENIDCIYFMARDGYIFEKAMKIYIDNSDSQVEMKYIYISRRSMRLINIYDELKVKDLERLFIYENVDGKTIENIFHRVGLDYNDYIYTCDLYGFSTKMQKIDLKNDKERLFNLFMHKIVQQDLINRARDERNGLSEYLKAIKFENNNKICMMDLVCRGTIFKEFSDYATKHYNVKLTSRNLATVEAALKLYDAGYDIEGCYATNGKPSGRIEMLTSVTPILEAVFTAPHPSVEYYYMDNSTGEYQVKFVEVLRSCEFKNKIIHFQEGILDEIKILVKSTLENDNYNNSLIKLSKLYFKPSKLEAKHLGGVGVQDYGNTYELGYPLRLYKYIINPAKGYKHYKGSMWKRAYLVNLFGPWVTNIKKDRLDFNNDQ